MTPIVTAAVGLVVGGPIGAVAGGVAPLVVRRLRSRDAPAPPIRLVLLLLLVQLRSGLSVLAALIAVSEALTADSNLRRVARVARVSGLVAAIPHADDRLRPMLSQLARAQRSGASLSGVVRRMLERRHNTVVDFEIIVPELLLKQEQRTKTIFNIVLGAIARRAAPGVMRSTARTSPLVSERYQRLQEAMIGRNRFDLFEFAAVGFVLSKIWIAPPFEPLAAVRGVKMFVNRGAPPMATMWTSWRGVADAEEALELLISDGLRHPLPVAGAEAPAARGEPLRVLPVERIIVDTRRARVDVDAPGEAIVMITQQDAPGWRAFIDGAETKKLLAGGVFRAVKVPAGRHQVEWRWNPASMRLGLAMTFITALSLQLSVFVKRSERRKFSS